ncbi:hypothetical protein ACI1MP_37215 (plasmid) [Kitasatospora griseola]|uniref:hypothetical protein n=1 Tax=Kitasatospora griseola TaxID=2064 RepID=UPI0038559CA1
MRPSSAARPPGLGSGPNALVPAGTTAAAVADRTAAAAGRRAASRLPHPRTGDRPDPEARENEPVTSTPHPPRGISALIPSVRPAAATPGERAATQLLHLREATVAVPVLAAALELIAPQLDAPDAATRDAAADVHARLLSAIEDATR